jgi:hypothetical protein
MRGFGWCWGMMLVVGVSGCGGRPAQQSAAAADSTPDAAEPPRAPAPEPAPPPAAVSDQPAAYIIHGVCPFECCKYGPNWTLLHGGALRSDADETADSIGSVADGATVVTDDGAMVLNPPGVAVVVPDTSNHNSGGPAVGDTVQVITYTGAKISHVRWNDQEFDIGWGALHLVHEPLQRWWVHMTDPVSGQAGWLQMQGISAQNVGTANNCTKAK